MILHRKEHPHLAWVIEHLLLLYIAAAITVLVVLAIMEALPA